MFYNVSVLTKNEIVRMLFTIGSQFVLICPDRGNKWRDSELK